MDQFRAGRECKRCARRTGVFASGAQLQKLQRLRQSLFSGTQPGRGKGRFHFYADCGCPGRHRDRAGCLPGWDGCVRRVDHCRGVDRVRAVYRPAL